MSMVYLTLGVICGVTILPQVMISKACPELEANIPIELVIQQINHWGIDTVRMVTYTTTHPSRTLGAFRSCREYHLRLAAPEWKTVMN